MPTPTADTLNAMAAAAGDRCTDGRPHRWTPLDQATGTLRHVSAGGTRHANRCRSCHTAIAWHVGDAGAVHLTFHREA